MLADALGRPLRLTLTGGQVHDIVTAPALLEGIDGGAVIADKAYDSNHLRQFIANADMLAVIPSIRPARSRSLTTPSSTKSATGSNAASTSSNTSDASQHASIDEPPTSSHSSTSHALCYGCGECQFSLVSCIGLAADARRAFLGSRAGSGVRSASRVRRYPPMTHPAPLLMAGLFVRSP